jgi:cell division protein FtsQ
MGIGIDLVVSPPGLAVGGIGMERKGRSKGDDATPRIYDKKSGEYRPVSLLDGRGAMERSARYETPQRRADTRKRRRHRAMMVFYLFTFITVIAAAVAVSLTVLFKIDSIQVNGTSRYSAEDIMRAGGIVKGENLFLAKTKEAGVKIPQKLPYIGTAKVTRRLPAQIVIAISEEPVSGAITYNQKYVVVSPSGKILELADAMPANCPEIKGLKISKAEVGKSIVYQDTSQQATFQSLTAAISSSKFQKVTQIDFSMPYKIQMVYDNRVIMNLGLPSDFDYKLRFAKSILDAGKIKDTEKGTLNLSLTVEDNNAFFDPSYAANSAVSSKTAQNSSK